MSLPFAHNWTSNNVKSSSVNGVLTIVRISSKYHGLILVLQQWATRDFSELHDCKTGVILLRKSSHFWFPPS